MIKENKGTRMIMSPLFPSLLCAHRGVEVEYDHEKHNFTCASLGSSKYTLDGDNIDGPAEKPLKNYEAALNDGILMIKL